MTEPTSELLQILTERGFVHQCTDAEGFDDLARDGHMVAYIGFDATADSLHVGSLIQVMTLRWLQKCGHKPVVLMGGGTTKVGDPSGKDTARQLMSEAQISANIAGIRQVFDSFLTFGDGRSDAIMVNNADWLDALGYIALLRDVGRHLSVNRMLTFDSVKLRLEREQPLSFLEFNYMVLQAYDFVELARRVGCQVQMGGSDQWGNIVSGIELGRRMENRALFGLTTPLLTTASGAKMGKTAQGAVWLNKDKLSAYDYWQFWRNTDDADVGRFLALFTDMPMDEVRRLGALAGAEINEAKKILANQVTTLCHGAAAAAEAAETARATFEDGATGDALPQTDIPRQELTAGIALFALLVRANLAASNSEARRLIKGGGARVNDAVVADDAANIGIDALGGNGQIKLSAGKKRHAMVRPV